MTRVIDDEMKRFLEGVVGAVEATNEEKHGLWERYVHNRDDPYTWESTGHGLLETVGWLDIRVKPRKFEKMPVCISLLKVKVQGHLILFYHATSMVVDNRLVETWLKETLPQSAFRPDGYVNKTDATNFCNILPR